MTTIFFAGTEDSDLYAFFGGTVNTGAGSFRSAFSRCGLQPKTTNTTALTVGLRSPVNFTSSNFWVGGWCFPSALQIGVPLITLLDTSGIPRVYFVLDSTTNTQMKAFKINAAGTSTQLGSGTFPHGISGATLSKIDVHVNYAVAGSLDLYVNGVNVFTFSGDVTTDGITSLANFAFQFSNSSGAATWSEMICADVDTRGLSLQTFAPVANGNTHTFDTGSPAAANVNEITLNDATLDGSSVANQIDQYTNGAVAAGTFDVLAFGVSARAQKGTSGPSKMDLNVRTGGSDFFSADIPLTVFWANYQNWWLTNPNTAAAWLTSQIGSAAGFNIGIKSIT